MAEYVLARPTHGVTDGTIRSEIIAVEQFLEHAGVFAWEIEPGPHLRPDAWMTSTSPRARCSPAAASGRWTGSPPGTCAPGWPPGTRTGPQPPTRTC
ncbi:MAG: hypothetical protein JO132_15905 [Streptosporangiaceae bacterium]|nr:hypothetical protein [Streptosporangiaceae bacterium]